MLLPHKNHLQPALPPTALPARIFPPYSIPRTLILPNLRRLSSAVRSSASDTRTVPDSAIQRIADKLRSLGFTEESTDNRSSGDEQTSAGEIFVPLPKQLPKFRVGHTIDTSWSTPAYPVPEPGTGTAISRYHELRNEWKREIEEERKKEERVPTLAELSLAPAELRRLRTIGIGLKKKMKVGKAGITEGIVNGIHERWRSSEVVKIVCEDICGMNMKRTHDVLERKTGGLVIWRSGRKMLLYRGANYKYPYFLADSNPAQETSLNAAESAETNHISKSAKSGLVQGVGSPGKVRFRLPGEAQMVEEADGLLDGLGPRFTDWWSYDPLPVDADLLPAVVPGYRKPYRLLPYGVSPKLTNDEMTTLRRLGRPLPCHFALGRNRKLQGLAAAIVKLWEKCEIAKIAVKRGVQNTNSEMMAEELKWLTGGTLIARDTEFIVLYRGKDFLPSAVSTAIEERRKYVMCTEERNANLDTVNRDQAEFVLGSIDETRDEEGDVKGHESVSLSKFKRLKSPEEAIEKASIKLSKAIEKKAEAEKLLDELEQKATPMQSDVDKEGITEEERFMLRKVGLRMKPFLLLGVRGVFAGTIENMHLHWKFRELVKIICEEKNIEAAYQVARILEAESGGILVAVERVSKGYAIIVYRGKNYQRPSTLRPRTLLSKREALKRSVEAQRRESLKLNVLKLTKRIEDLNQQGVKDNIMNSAQLGQQSRVRLTKEDGQGVKLQGISLAHNEKSIYESNSSYRRDHLESSSSARAAISASSDPAKTSFHRDASMPGLSSSAGINAEQRASGSANEKIGISERVEHESQVALSSVTETRSINMTSRAINLSNKERLLLRKQALKMKKRPSLAVGRSNAISGLAKAINAHFAKNPLAIVNVKGRAKGTSVQEVVLKLQEATGAVLVSQEPSKVILYRGYGAETQHGRGNDKARGSTSPSERVKDRAQTPVSPELIEAIKLECGLLDHHKERCT